MIQNEVEETVNVLSEEGELCGAYWAREPLFVLDQSRIWTARRYCTFQDVYIIFSNSFLFVFEMCDNGAFSFLHVSAVSLLDRHTLSKTIKFPVFSDGIHFSSKNRPLEFIVMDDETHIIKVDIPQIGNNRRLRGEVVLFNPNNAQSLYMTANWHDEKKSFKLIRSSPWWSVEGVMQFENTDLPFLRNRAWGIYYNVKMARSKNDIHYWAAGCGMQDGRQFAFSIGYGGENSSSCTENAAFVNGILIKLEYVTFQVSPVSMLSVWSFTSNNKQLTMNFYPLQIDKYSIFFLNHSDSAQRVFGFFSGVFILNDGSEFHFNKLCGVVEYRRRT
ncbi:MAG: DUF2804 domain-containing protein [Spirochaetaceae bacterium]|nr:DUF2804 domain-containing protein [Spirochaetaceae bacterium]